MFNYKLMARKFTLALGLIVLCSLTISGARKPQLGISFHLEGSQSDAQGRKLLTVIDSEPVDFIVLNEPIHDGYIVVWGGLTKADLAKFDKEFPRIQPSKSNTQSLIPERATSREETREAPPIRVEESGTEEPNKKRKRLFNFGSSKKDS